MKLNPFRKEIRQAPQSGLAIPEPWLSTAFGTTATISAERVNPQTALRMASVFSAVNIIAETVGGLPLNVYRQIDQVVIDASDHRSYNMLHKRPNPFTPANRFWSAVSANLLTYGNAFIEKLRDDTTGTVNELRLIHPQQVRINYSEDLGLKSFSVTRQLGRTDGPYDDTRILHIMGLSEDGIIGMSPIAQARENLGIAKARERFEADLYAQQPWLSGTLKAPGKIADGGVKLRESWRAIYSSGSRDRHGIAVLEDGVTYDPIRAHLADLQFIEGNQMSRTDVAVLFKLPPTYLGGSLGDSLTYQTVEGNQIQFAKQCIWPLVQTISQAVSQDFGVFSLPSWFCAFDIDELMRGDSGTRSAYYTAALTAGWMTIPEVRQRENLPPLEEEQEQEQLTEADLEAEDAIEGDAVELPPEVPQIGSGQPTAPSKPVLVPAHSRQLPTRKQVAA